MRRIAALTAGLALVAAPGAAASPASPDALIHELLELSGARRQATTFPEHLREQSRAREGELDPAAQAQLVRILGDTFRAEAFLALVAERLHADYDVDRLQAVLAWLRSPLGRRITQLEVEASGAPAQAELRRYAERLGQHPPREARLTLVRRLDAAAGVSEAALDLMGAMFRAMARVVDPLLPPAKRLKPGELEQITAQMLAQGREPIRVGNLVTMLFAYRALGDAELGRYLVFLESEPGQWYTRAVNQGFVHAMATLTERAVGELARHLPPPPR